MRRRLRTKDWGPNEDEQTMIIIRKAGQEDIRNLSKKLQGMLKDKKSQFYHENVAKFEIPEEYVQRAFAEETMLKAAALAETTFFLAIEGDDIIGFAQTIQQDDETTELDRIVVFPQHTRRGVGTQLLKHAVVDQEQKRIKRIIVKAGIEEVHARRFYEKNCFEHIMEETIESPWGKKITLVTYQLRL